MKITEFDDHDEIVIDLTELQGMSLEELLKFLDEWGVPIKDRSDKEKIIEEVLIQFEED